MCDVCREVSFSQNNFYKLAKHELATMSLSQKDSPWSGNKLTLQSKKKGSWSSSHKEGNADSVLGH